MMASQKIECLVTVKGETVKMETEIPDDVGTYSLVASETGLSVVGIDPAARFLPTGVRFPTVVDPDGEEDIDLDEATQAELRRLITAARTIAAKVGPLHALWDVILDAEALLDGSPTILRGGKQETATHLIALLASAKF